MQDKRAPRNRQMVVVVIVLALGIGLSGCFLFPGLQAVITLSPGVIGEAPFTVTFNSGDSTGWIESREWNFGDPQSGADNTSTLVAPSHTYGDDEIYVVTLTVVNAAGKTSQATVAITVTNPPPIASLLATPARGPAPLAVEFDLSGSVDPAAIIPTPTSGYIESFTLDFGDGTPVMEGSDIATPIVHTYTSAEYRAAVLTVTDDDGATGSTVAPIAVEGVVGFLTSPDNSPAGLTFDGEYLWHSDWQAKTIYKISPEDGHVVTSFPAPGEGPLLSLSNDEFAEQGVVIAPEGTPQGLAWEDSYLWVVCVSDGKIYKLNPAIPSGSSGHVITTLETPGYSPFGLAFDGTYLWCSDYFGQKVYKINPATGMAISSFDAPGTSGGSPPLSVKIIITDPTHGTPTGLAWQNGALWVASDSDDTVYKVDPSTGMVLDSINSPDTLPAGLAFDGAYLWNADANTGIEGKGRLYKLVAP